MIPDPVTWGHVLMLAGLIAGLYGLVRLAAWAKHRGSIRGTPQYASARDGRRYGLAGIAGGALLYLAGCFTPLAELAIA